MSDQPRRVCVAKPLSPEWLSKHIVKIKLKALFLWEVNKEYSKRLVNEISFLYQKTKKNNNKKKTTTS